MVASFLTRVGGLVPVASGSTWNPSDKGGDIVLSNSNRTASGTMNTGHGVRGTQGRSTGKRVIEYTLVTNASNYAWWGLATTGLSVTGYMGAANTFVGHYMNSSDVFYDNGGAQLLGGYGFVTGANNTGDFTIAVDFDATLLWISYNGGDWNNSGSADPATGTGGKDFSTLSPTPSAVFYPYVGADDDDVWLLNTGQEAFAKALPSGFSAWG